MRFLSVCSGIEAATVAWAPFGWKASGFAEIEPFPSAVLKHHYPDVPNHGDMTQLPAKILAGEVEAPDLLCGGTPCQAFSVAGLRQSLDDARGNLTLTFCEIADAIDSIRKQPAIVFWENVPGVLNTKDNAFGCFLGALAGESDALVAPGGRWSNAGFIDGAKRAVAWRVLDAQYFGVAQRRRRVFVVASARADFDPAAVLFEFEGVRRDTAPSRETGEDAAGSTGSGVARRRWPADVSSTLDTTFGTKQGLEDQHVNSGCPMFVPVTANAITASMANSCLGHNKDENVLAFDAYNQSLTEDVSKTVASRTDQDTASCIAYGIPGNWIGRAPENGGNATEPMHDVAPCLTKADRHGVAQPIPFDTTQITSPHNGSNPQPGAPCHPLAAGAHPPAVAFNARQDPDSWKERTGPLDTHAGTQAVAFSAKDYGGDASNELAPTMRAMPHDGSHANGGGQLAVAQHMAVRRLTPVECERLQGFPDRYTEIPWRTYQEAARKGISYETLLTQRGMTLRGPSLEDCPDGPRYKALGNSWAVPVVRWIGGRIVRALA